MPFRDSTIESIQDPIPSAGVDLFRLITDLGDPLFFILLVSLVYWLTDHRTAIWVVAAMLLVFGLTSGLKELFAIERPAAELQHITEDGYGIPSGYASGAVAIYGSLAALYDAGPRWARYGVAAVLAGLIAFSRLVLGVHYVADFVAGIALGLFVVVLVVFFRARESSPLPFFVVGAVAALVGAVLSDFTYGSALLLFGGALAASALWLLITPLPDPSRRTMALCSVFALPIVVGVSYVGLSVFDSPIALVSSTAIAMAVVLVLPHVGEQVETRFAVGQ